MKKNLLTVGIIALAVFFLTGCQAPQAAPEPASTPVGEIGGLETELAELESLEEELGTEDLEDLDEVLGVEF